jgi:hypothetical protein
MEPIRRSNDLFLMKIIMMCMIITGACAAGQSYWVMVQDFRSGLLSLADFLAMTFFTVIVGAVLFVCARWTWRYQDP